MVFADKIKPIRGQVLIRMESINPSSIIEIPEQFRDVPQTGMVVDVGNKPRTAKDIEVEHEVIPGDRVFLPPHCGKDLSLHGIPHKLVAEWQILAVLG
jgi:co-chaperonin GroES (HSP10)